LINYHYSKKNYQLAFELDKVADNLQDSINELAKNAVKYKAFLEEEKKENAELEVEKVSITNERLALEKQSLVLLSVGIITFLLLLIRFNTYRNKKKKELAWKEADNLIREQELNLAYARLEGRNEERERIARDLHDGLGGMLATVKLQFGIVERKIGELESGVFEQINMVSTLLDQSSDEVRRISHNMLSSSLEEYGLRYIVEQLAEDIRQSRQIEVNVDTHNMEERLDKFLEVKLYRIIQELIRNILKHAKAERIDIQLNRFDDTINFMIEDNGVGFNLEAVKAKRKGIGIENIEKRVEELDGTIKIDSEIGRGTSILIDIPMKEDYE
jgi:signal transduction histidine kinase